jgi:hypothetical protein
MSTASSAVENDSPIQILVGELPHVRERNPTAKGFAICCNLALYHRAISRVVPRYRVLTVGKLVPALAYKYLLCSILPTESAVLDIN